MIIREYGKNFRVVREVEAKSIDAYCAEYYPDYEVLYTEQKRDGEVALHNVGVKMYYRKSDNYQPKYLKLFVTENPDVHLH